MSKERISCRILGADINVTNMKDTVQYIRENLDALKGHYVCVSNVHTTVMAYRDTTYREIQNRAAINIPDGKPLAVVQKHAGFKRAERVAGPDLMPEIFKISGEQGYRHFFFGSTQATLDRLKENLRARYPRMKIVGMFSPPFRLMTAEEDAQIVNMINAADPDFIWVGLGAPKQEKWMAEHEGRVCGLMLGVGAGFDFHAGTVKRAPLWMQECCMEWLYRLRSDPKRLLPRYLDVNFSFLYYLIRERLSHKKKKKVSRQKNGLKIAMIGHKRIPSREGGIELVVDALATRMAAKGYQVDVYNRYGKHMAGRQSQRKKYYKGVRIITIPTPKTKALNALVYSFLSTVRALFGSYDIIHYHAEGPCAMLWIPKLFGIRVVATIHGLDWQRAKWGNLAARVLLFGEKMAARQADELIVLSKNMQEYFLKKYSRETVYIPNGIERPRLRTADLICREYGLEKDSYILFLARIVPEKGLHYLIEAFSALDTKKKLVIAGGSSQSDEYVNRIKQMAAQDPRILMTDFVHDQCLEELYSNAYIYVLPSDVEGMALSLLEAMSYGNCCLVSNIKENTEVVEAKAVIFEKGDVEDLRRKLKMLLDDPKQVELYKKDSQDFICKKYDWDRVLDDTLKLYTQKK